MRPSYVGEPLPEAAVRAEYDEAKLRAIVASAAAQYASAQKRVRWPKASEGGIHVGADEKRLQLIQEAQARGYLGQRRGSFVMITELGQLWLKYAGPIESADAYEVMLIQAFRKTNFFIREIAARRGVKAPHALHWAVEGVYRFYIEGAGVGEAFGDLAAPAEARDRRRDLRGRAPRRRR